MSGVFRVKKELIEVLTRPLGSFSYGIATSDRLISNPKACIGLSNHLAAGKEVLRIGVPCMRPVRAVQAQV